MTGIKSTHAIVETKELSDEDADYLAKWIAKAMAGRDCYNYLITGVAYEDDPEAHELLMRSCLDRGSVTGTILVTKDLKGCRLMFRPGELNRCLDIDWESPKDDAWNAMLLRCGGKEAIMHRVSKHFEEINNTRVELYGPDGGLEHYRSSNFAVHPDCQGTGIGTTINNYIHEEAKKSGKIFFFGSYALNVPIYERMGARSVGTPVAVPLDRPELYPPGNNLWHNMQMDP